eukprot:TRINITY_DN2179_c0_g1_i1.p1 TRINITY_DN2179_c0_g1~~TRINITY_DN2179_c0_g1_i1.p1  ORF type:complete len:468 (+),score=144.96 TRINITY_DN2179_c0_g1_i1:40-1443(+)
MKNENVDGKKSKKKGQVDERKILHSLDKVINTPTATKRLLDDSTASLDSPVLNLHKNGMKNGKEKKSGGNSEKKLSIKKSLSDTALKKTKSSSGEMKKELEQTNDADNTAGPGHILRQGIKFTSQNSFFRYINMPSKKGSRSKKRAYSDMASPPPHTGANNQGFNNSVREQAAETEEISPIRKKKKSANETNEQSFEETTDSVHHRLNKSRIRDILSSTRSESVDETHQTSKVDSSSSNNNGSSSKKKSFIEKAKDKLISSRFRYINEMLYTQTSSQSVKMFKEDSSLFQAYHQGFQQQAGAWPMDPLDTIISACMHLPDSAVVADMGCGEARLAKSIPNTVHSFDLVGTAPGVIECDMSKVPLPDQSVDVVIFCLSLMGTNVKDFLLEASRILKIEGILKIAELESRFQGQENEFIKDVEKFGFQMNWKNLKNQYFVFFDFKKVKEAKSRKKLPSIDLKPCVYKKR